MLQSMGSQKVRHDLATEQQCVELIQKTQILKELLILSLPPLCAQF